MHLYRSDLSFSHSHTNDLGTAFGPFQEGIARIDITTPIHIFHGTDDANVPVESVYDLQKRFDICHKTNLTIHIFEKHSHDLNFYDIITKKDWSQGHKAIFKVAEEL